MRRSVSRLGMFIERQSRSGVRGCQTTVLAVLVLALTLANCNLLPFFGPHLSLPGGLRLQKDDTGSVILAHSSRRQMTVVDLAGTITRVGFNAELIVLFRESSATSGEPSGWFLVNPNNRELTGPYNEQVVNDLIAGTDIQIRAVSEVLH